MNAIRLFLIFVLAALAIHARADTAVHNVRMWQAPDHTRLVFDLDAPLEYQLFMLKEPHRLVLDLSKARMGGSWPELDATGPVVAGMRAASRDGDLRIVVDLKTEVQPRAFVLKPYEQYGHRLVVDLLDAKAQAEQAGPVQMQPRPARPVSRELVIAIDAGHGGEDPGAIGRRGTREKDVVLAIARELYKMINETPGMRAVLVRNGDYYIALRDRIEKARRHDPDAFISIHADAVPGKRQVRGASVYALSERGATREAAYLAARENAADLIGGVSLNDKDDLLTKVLVDMTQTGTINSSVELGMDILAELKRVGPVHAQTVGQAGFMVLRSPYIPSVLIETAFISNPEEERKLASKVFQRHIARGVVNGLKRAAPRLLARRTPGQITQATVSARQHVVQKGETLEQIARQYGVNIDALRFFNDVRSAHLPAGLKLRIPDTDS